MAVEVMRAIPLPLRAAAATPMGRVSPTVWQRVARALPGHANPHFGGKFQKTLRVAGSARRFDDVYLSFLDEWSLEQSPVLNASRGDPGFDLAFAAAAPPGLRMMYCDAVSLSARRHFVQGRSGFHGREPRDTSPIPRPSGGRGRRAHPVGDEGTRPERESTSCANCCIAMLRARCFSVRRQASPFQ